jgi:drug/metabolite transporter (DMT)-like permease
LPAQQLSPRLRILGAALLFSTGGAVIKMATANVWQLAGLRAGIAGVFLVLVLPGARRLTDRRVLGVGALYAVMTVSYVTANLLTTAGNVMFLIAASPLVVLTMSWCWLGERPSRANLLLMLPLALGLALCLAPGQTATATAPNPTLGNVFALVTLVVWSSLLVALRALGGGRSRSEDLAPSAIAAGNLMAAAVCLPVAGTVADLGLLDWSLVTYLGVLQIGLAYVWLTAGMRRVAAFESSLLLLAEPVLNPVWAWAVHGELPSRFAAVGGGIILGSLAAKLWWVDRRTEIEPGG